MRPCPSEQDLLAFHLGTLPEDRLEAWPHTWNPASRAKPRFDTWNPRPIRFSPHFGSPSPGRRPGRGGPLPDRSARCGSLSEAVSNPAEPAFWPKVPGYEVIDYLGRGGMGVVYKARDLRLGRLVALKRLRSDDERELRRSRLEAETLAHLQHPHIVQLYEMARAPGSTLPGNGTG